MNRDSGRTTKQMQNAPDGAVFVWVNGHIKYPRDLAKSLGRNDLEIVSPDWLESGRYQGRRITGIIIDHAARLTSRQFDGLEIARGRVVRA